MSEEIILPVEYEYSDEDVVLDPYNSDLNLVIDKECLLAYPLSYDGFAFMWAGCRATYGVSCGRAAFEAFLTDYCESEDIPKDQEQDLYSIRIGWSLDSSFDQLGEGVFSYAYCSNGKKLNKSIYEDYGEPFEKSDSVAAYIDYDTNPDALLISFTKNGIDFGTAFTVAKSEILNEIRQFNEQKIVFFPHFLSRNVVFEVNFGQRESLLGDEPFAPMKSNFDLIKKITLDKRIRGEVAPKERKDCEVIMLVGLPGSGKTHWAIEYCKKNPKKRFNLLGISSIIDKMKTYDSKKRTNVTSSIANQANASVSQNAKLSGELFEKASKCMNKLIEYASQLNRNIILDQYNVYASARRRKMTLFEGYTRKAIIIVPSDDVYRERIKRVETEENREFSVSMINNMKASFTLPEAGEVYDSVEYVELNETSARELVDKYNLDGPAARLQLILDKRSKMNDENRQADPRAFATSVRLQRSGYGYGKQSTFYRNPFPSNKRPYLPPQMQMGRFGAPFGLRPAMAYAAYPPGAWNPALQSPVWPAAVGQQPPLQNDWMPALPINPYQVPQQPQWPGQPQPQWTTQVQQQQQSQQVYNSWTPAMSTNVTNTNPNQNQNTFNTNNPK